MGRGKGTNTADKAMILEWLKQKGNFDHIEGRLGLGLSVVAGNRLTKDSAYAKLSDYIEKKTGKSKKDSTRTGYGVTEKDRKNGVKTIEEKLEKACPYFQEMDELFGERQNVNPTLVSTSESIDHLIDEQEWELENIFDNDEPDENSMRIFGGDSFDNEGDYSSTVVLNSDEDDSTQVLDTLTLINNKNISNCREFSTPLSKRIRTFPKPDSASKGRKVGKGFDFEAFIALKEESNTKKHAFKERQLDFKQTFKEREIQLQQDKMKRKVYFIIVTIDRYTDFQVTKQIPVVPLPAPYFHSETFDIVAHDYKLWSRQFIQKLDTLTSFEGDIDIPHTGEIFRYISLWKSRIVKDVQQTIDSILVQQLPNITLEPHNFDFLLSIWDQKVSLGQCIQNLADARLLKEVPIDLRKMERSWNLFNRFSPEESDIGTINNKWSHESAEIILAFRSRIEKAKNRPTYDLLDFDRYLDEWMKYSYSHLLSYSAVKVKALVLAKGKEEGDKKELSRLCRWRMAKISEIQGRFTQVLKLSKLIIKNDEVFSDKADESSRYFALGLVDDLFLQELLVWTTFRVENLKAFEESIEQYVIRGLAAVEKIQEHVQRKDIIELVSKHKEKLAHLLQALIARSNVPVGTHFWEHDLQVQTVYTTTRVFDCCKSVLFDSEAVLHCSHCNQYFHQKCSPAFYCLPCKTPNATYECKLEETEFNFTVDYSPKLLKDTEYNKLVQFSMDILATNLPYKVAVVKDSCYVSINDTRNEPAFLHNFFTDAIKPKASSKEMIGLLGAFNSKAIELYTRIWDEIPSDISRVYFCGRGIGGTIAHCLNLKSILKKQNSFSIAFGSPTPFRNGTSAYLQENKLAGRFISVMDMQDVAPAIIKLLSIGKSSKDFDAYKNSNPTLHKIITTATFSSKFLCESIEPVGHYVVLDRDNLHETNDMAKISNLFGKVVVTGGKPLDEMDKIYFNLIE
ncbi:hypothetical protein HDV04_005527 [Boothiomyces sp. JEL0838]|nr:hypothetical protein HDV04_005527 [Boothiomyces sp. JEL0838]